MKLSSRLLVTVTVLTVGTIAGSLPAATVVTGFEPVPAPNASRFTNQLTGVYAAGPNDVWAVGDGGGETLIAHSTGAEFVRVPSGNLADRTNKLAGVDGTGPADIWAVGSAGRIGAGTRTLIQHFDGTAWSVVPSPNPGFADDSNVLTAVAAVAPDDVWAVGTHRPADSGSAGQRPLVLHWNGTAWSSVATSCGAVLSGISAAGPADIWAVGGGAACHYDGTGWTPVRAAPDPIANRTVTLLDVATLGQSSAWAVGYVSIPCGENVCANAELQRWDGARWSRAVPFTRFPNRWAVGIDAVSASDIWAVTTDGVLHYDGTAWTEVSAPPIAPNAVTADSGRVWVVGSDGRGSPSRTAVLRSLP